MSALKASSNDAAAVSSSSATSTRPTPASAARVNSAILAASAANAALVAARAASLATTRSSRSRMPNPTTEGPEKVTNDRAVLVLPMSIRDADQTPERWTNETSHHLRRRSKQLLALAYSASGEPDSTTRRTTRNPGKALPLNESPSNDPRD